MAIKIISTRTYSSKKLINGSLKMKTQNKAPMKPKTASTRSSSVRFSLENNTVLNVPAIADYRYIELHRMFYRPKDYARFQLEAEREHQAPPRKTITQSCLKPRTTASSTTKSVRFDMQNITIHKVPSLQSYTFVELYRLYYRSKEYDSFLRDVEQEEESSKTLKIRPVSSPKVMKKGITSKKMAHKIRSSASSLQSVIISAASA